MRNKTLIQVIALTIALIISSFSVMAYATEDCGTGVSLQQVVSQNQRLKHHDDAIPLRGALLQAPKTSKEETESYETHRVIVKAEGSVYDAKAAEEKRIAEEKAKQREAQKAIEAEQARLAELAAQKEIYNRELVNQIYDSFKRGN